MLLPPNFITCKAWLGPNGLWATQKASSRQMFLCSSCFCQELWPFCPRESRQLWWSPLSAGWEGRRVEEYFQDCWKFVFKWTQSLPPHAWDNFMISGLWNQCIIYHFNITKELCFCPINLQKKTRSRNLFSVSLLFW